MGGTVDRVITTDTGFLCRLFHVAFYEWSSESFYTVAVDKLLLVATRIQKDSSVSIREQTC